MDDKNTNVSFAEYDFGHIAYVIKDTKALLNDAMYSIGLSRTSEKTLLRKALDKIEFIDKVMRDSKETLKDIKYIAYSDPDEVSDPADPKFESSAKCCCKNEA